MKFYTYNMHKNRILKNWKVADVDGNEICTIDANHPAPVSTARLLAAAPQLLEALTALVNCPDYENINTHEMYIARDLVRTIKMTGK